MRRSGTGGGGTSFEVTGRVVRGTRIVSLVGDVDLAAAVEVRAHLDAAVAPSAPRVVVDMTRVDFVDSSFLHSLTRTWRQARAAGGEIAVVCSDPGIRRLLEVFGLTRRIRIFDELGQAVAALAR